MRAKIKKTIIILIVIMVIAILLLVGTIASDILKMFRNKDRDYDFAAGPEEDIPEPPPEGNLEDVVDWEDGSGAVEGVIDFVIDPERTNILLVGVDKRPGSKRAPISDSIIIFSYKDDGKPVLISIPRDTYVNIPGRGMDKINHSHAFGGVALLRQAVEEFTKIPIHYYLRVNFNGFEQIVDMLGGVEVYVDKDIKHLKKGTQVLNGADALTFCRFRKDAKGDFGRAERQQRFLVAVIRQVQKGSVTKLPSLIKEGAEHLDTDFSLGKLLDFAKKFSNINPDKIAKYVAVGKGFYYKGVYYSQPLMEEFQKFLAENMGK